MRLQLNVRTTTAAAAASSNSSTANTTRRLLLLLIVINFVLLSNLVGHGFQFLIDPLCFSHGSFHDHGIDDLLLFRWNIIVLVIRPGSGGQVPKGGVSHKGASDGEFGGFRGRYGGFDITSLVLKLLPFLHSFHDALSFLRLFCRIRIIMIIIMMVIIVVIVVVVGVFDGASKIMQHDKGRTVDASDIGWWW